MLLASDRTCYQIFDTRLHNKHRHTVRRHIRIERENGKKLRKTPWWMAQIQKGECHFCHQLVGAEYLTMDHVVPLARKGKSTRGNVVPACQACNRNKNLTIPVETIS